jgi:hypothetical protein
LAQEQFDPALDRFGPARGAVGSLSWQVLVVRQRAGGILLFFFTPVRPNCRSQDYLRPKPMKPLDLCR